MPVLYIGHGSPMNAIEDNEFSRAWSAVGKALPCPKAILCISAHWESKGTQVTAMEKPRTIYDFYGFPPELYAVRYSAPGSPELAKHVQDLLKSEEVMLDQRWGLDHGTWSVLTRLIPKPDVPVIQLSLDINKHPQEHYDMGEKLKLLRDEGVLILGSGNIVHNLRMLSWDEAAFDWALEFDTMIKQWILDHNHEPIIQYQKQGKAAALAINSAEHYKPLLYVLSAGDPSEPIHFFTEKVTMGSISMRAVQIG
jgi:4,5-DOPA dioxygenase extradiol